jgi:hypothetical protein
MVGASEDVAKAMGALQAKAEEVHSLQNKMQTDLTAAIDGESSNDTICLFIASLFRSSCDRFLSGPFHDLQI